MRVAIITIGDEILIGQIVDTNSTWMALELTKAGFEVNQIFTVDDNAENIKKAIDEAFQRVDIVLTTGGLGPTKDDITKKTLCEYFGTEMIYDISVLENIEKVIQNVHALNELTRNQAYVPKDCTVIQNKVGTAPLTWFERKNKVLVSIPGVPYEMRYNMEHEIIPRLQGQFETESYIYEVLLVKGYAESKLAIHLEDFENNLPKDFGLAYLPSPRLVKLRLFVKGDEHRTEFDKQFVALKSLLKGSILAEGDHTIEMLVSSKLKEKGLTLGAAESCTGGRIAHLLTSIAGSSSFFEGSVVSYSYASKVKMLGVKQSSLDKYGAVSQEVVYEMVDGIQKLLNVDCAIAVSGIAGPAGGTNEKPVGMVWIATRLGEKTNVVRHQFGKYREANIMGASNMALLQLLEML